MITTTILKNGLIRTVSDTYLIRKVGTNEVYSEAVDIPNSGYEYEVLEYIESTGTQWIDTEWKYSDTATFESHVELSAGRTTKNVLFGYRSTQIATPTGDMRFLFIYGKGSYGVNGAIGVRFGVSNPNTSKALSDNKKYKITLDKSDLKIDDALWLSVTNKYQPADYKNVYLFWANAEGYSVQNIAKFQGKVYDFTIYDNGSFVRDFIPVRRLSDGVLGMYDSVTKRFFTNKGSGTFVAGNPTGKKI